MTDKQGSPATEALLPCPFCGSNNIDPEGWVSTDRAGPACDDCAGTADTVELWNTRASQPAAPTDEAATAPASDSISFINKRLEDLAEASAIYGKDQRFNAPDKIARNEREISWLKELRSILGAAQEATVEDLSGLIEHGLCYGISSKDARIAARIAICRLGTAHHAAQPSPGWEDIRDILTGQMYSPSVYCSTEKIEELARKIAAAMDDQRGADSSQPGSRSHDRADLTKDHNTK